MDLILGKVTQQAMNYAIRSGVTLTASYAISQSRRLWQNAPKGDVRDDLYEQQQRLQHKIRIVSPAIDLIELIAARGNTSLESAVSLTKELRLEIQAISQKLARAAATSAEYQSGSAAKKAALKTQNEQEMQIIAQDIKAFLVKIEDAVPFINLALTTSGAKLSTQLPSTVSPSRLLQASTFLTTGDTQYMRSPHEAAQIGPTFVLSVYMLFAGHQRLQTEEEIRETTWKEVIHKAQVKLRRVPLDVVLTTGSGSDALPSHKIKSSRNVPAGEDTQTQRADNRVDEYAYQLMIVEDFDDDRHHDFEDEDTQPGPFDDVALAGIREMVPVHEISKIFYADTSKVLNISMDAEANKPVLLLRRDINAAPPRRMYERENLDNDIDTDPINLHSQDDGTPKTQAEKRHVEEDRTDQTHDPWRLPPSLDPEWIAFEVYQESETSSSDHEAGEDEIDDEDRDALERDPDTSKLEESLSAFHLNSSQTNTNSFPTSASQLSLRQPANTTNQNLTPRLKTSLSMLELLLRLTSLQQFQQQSHLSITDELLNFFLEESSSTGAGGDETYRQHLRADARRRVGWDPYDESPVKRRGEEYQYRASQDFYESPNVRDYYDQHTAQSPSMSSARGQSPLSPGAADSSYSPSSRVKSGHRPDWLRAQGQSNSRKGSPLRPISSATDEGLGTSPASSRVMKQQ